MPAPIHALGWTLIHFGWQGTGLGLVVGIALWTLEGRDSRLRYGVACLGLVLMMAVPPLTYAWVQTGSRTVAQAQVPTSVPMATMPHNERPSLAQAPPWSKTVNLALPWLVLAWALGSLAMSLRLAGGWAWLQWLRRRPDTQPATDAEQLALLRLCQRMGVASNLRLMLCRSVPGPTVLGWLKPMILIPPAMLTGLSPQQLEMILAHELAHVLRHDYLVNLLQSVAEVLLFFHPAVWWISKQIRQEREQASDDLAVRLCGDALDYAQALTALEALAARVPKAQPAPRLALGAQGGHFMSRIHRLISPAAPTALAPRAGLVVLLLLAGAYAVQARSHQDSPGQTQPAAALGKGTLVLRRYDITSPDGQTKAGTIDLRAASTTQACIEKGLAELQAIPADRANGYVDLTLTATPEEPGSRWTYKFTGVDPARVMTIIRAQAAVAAMEREPEPGVIRIMRVNSFTYQAGLLPKGLNVFVRAGNVPAKLVLDALNELEAMQPKAGIPQEVRKVVQPGTGTGVTLSIDGVDPLEVRTILEKMLGKS